MQQAEAPFAILECICRQKKDLTRRALSSYRPKRKLALPFSSMAQATLRSGIGREITLDEAMSILEQKSKNRDWFFNHPIRKRPSSFVHVADAAAVCSVCIKNLPKTGRFLGFKFLCRKSIPVHVMDVGNCEKRCQVGAASVSEKVRKKRDRPETVVSDAGYVCPRAPKKAISLRKKATEVRPPQTREDLYDIIMSHKKGKLGKLKVTGKLLVDAIRTGQTHFA